MAEETRLHGSGGRAAKIEVERRRQQVPPFVELVVQFGDDRRELVDIGGDAVVACVEEIMHAVEQTAHRDAGEEVKRGFLFCAGGGVCVVLSR